MTKLKSTKRALLASALALVMCISMFVGSTFAWFNDSAASGINTIQAGTLDIVLEYKDANGVWQNAEGKTLEFKAADGRTDILWEPGCTYELPAIRVRNNGNLALKYELLINGTTGDAKLLEAIVFTANGDSVTTFRGTLDTNGAVSDEIVIKGHMKDDANNDYQGLTAEGIGITVVATQNTYEKDSYGDQYDANATYPQVVTDTYKGGDTITVGDVSVTLPATAEEDVYSLKVDNVMKSTDAAGQTTLSLNIDLLKNGVKVNAESGVTYAVNIYVGKNLNVVEAKHNGEAITDFRYNIDTGIGSFSTDSFSPFEFIYKTLAAKVGNNVYYTIDEAIANWTNNTTLTLLSDATLTDVVKLKSTEHHILNLGTYTLTAASGKNAFEIIASGTGSSERSAITVKADANNPGGINAEEKSVIYYDYSEGGISGEDRPIIKIEGGVFTGGTSKFGTNMGIYAKGSAARKCATINISGGTFNCNILGTGKSKMLISGGLFNYSVSSQGDSTAYRLISGGTFKTLGFMTADSNNTKFWIGTKMAVSDVGVYIDENNYLVVGGPVITEAGDRFKDPSSSYSSWSNYLQYSSAKDYGLYYVK